MHFQVQNLESAISDVCKTILPEHLLLLANSLSVTGEFVGLNAKGIARQNVHESLSSPFVQACFTVSSQINYFYFIYLFIKSYIVT